jgi:hypothetical protein
VWGALIFRHRRWMSGQEDDSSLFYRSEEFRGRPDANIVVRGDGRNLDDLVLLVLFSMIC